MKLLIALFLIFCAPISFASEHNDRAKTCAELKPEIMDVSLKLRPVLVETNDLLVMLRLDTLNIRSCESHNKKVISNEAAKLCDFVMQRHDTLSEKLTILKSADDQDLAEFLVLAKQISDRHCPIN